MCFHDAASGFLALCLPSPGLHGLPGAFQDHVMGAKNKESMMGA